jgi:hypothetical protein
LGDDVVFVVVRAFVAVEVLADIVDAEKVVEGEASEPELLIGHSELAHAFGEAELFVWHDVPFVER